MSDSYHHGIRIEEISGGARPLQTVATSVIGLVASGNDADATAFPLNTPVLVTDIDGAIAKAGDDGTLVKSLDAIHDNVRPIMVVVRVHEDEDNALTTTNAVAGANKLLAAQGQLGVRPRILGAPGFQNVNVRTAMVEVAKKLRGMVYSGLYSAGVDTPAEAITARGAVGDRELMLLWPSFRKRGDTVSAAAYALGLRAKIDQEQGWHKTLSNVVLEGPTGINEDVYFDLQSDDTDAALLNAAGITTMINHEGYRFWGSRTCSDDPLFAFESAVRTGQILQDTIAEGLMWAADKPLHPSIARDIIETINRKFAGLQRAGRIIGGSAWLVGADNPTDQLAAGKMVIDYDYTPVPPLENLTLRQRITDRYFANFASQVAQAAS